MCPNHLRPIEISCAVIAAAGSRFAPTSAQIHAALWPIERVLETALGYRDQLRATRSWIGEAGALNLASSLAFVRIAGADGALGPLADARPLLDMQAITAARHAAAAAAA